MPWRSAPFWAGWYDQGHYLTSTLALARGDLSAPEHWYPLGYSLLATPFAWLSRSDPFFVPDLLLFVSTASGFQRAMRNFGIGDGINALIFLAACLVQVQVAKVWLQPWNTNLSAAILWWLIAGTTRSLGPLTAIRSVRPRDAVLLGCLAGALPLTRPIDALLSLICLSSILFSLWRHRRPFVHTAGLMLVGALLPIIPYLLLHLAIYGPHITQYMADEASIGFAPADIGWKAYVLVITPRPWFPGTRSILETVPWMIFGAAGMLGLIATGPRERRTSALLLSLLLCVSALPFIAYVDLQPPGLWKFKNFHYFKWFVPYLAACALVWIDLLRHSRTRAAALFSLIAVSLPLGIRIVPVAVGDREPARMLMFRSDTSRGWSKTYFAPAIVTDRHGAQQNVKDFRLMPDDAGVRAIAAKRMFADDPVLNDPRDAVVLANKGLPYARYGEDITFGRPCWLDQKWCSIPRQEQQPPG